MMAGEQNQNQFIIPTKDSVSEAQWRNVFTQNVAMQEIIFNQEMEKHNLRVEINNLNLKISQLSKPE